MGKDSVFLLIRWFLISWIVVRIFSEIGFLMIDYRDNLIISIIESVLIVELGEIMLIVVW